MISKLDQVKNTGQITITGNHHYHNDIFGNKVPDAKNQQYIKRRNKMHEAMKEAIRKGEI
jgi:hypothetical protein